MSAKVNFKGVLDRVILGRVRHVSQLLFRAVPPSSKLRTQTWRLPAVRSIMAKCQKQVKKAQSE